MKPTELKEFDLNRRAENGLRRGCSTGSCATAAVKAALSLLLNGEKRNEVPVTLPDRIHYLRVPILNSFRTDECTVRAEVLKDGGDDPDNTHGATIFAEVRKNDCGEIRFFAGEGVGTATRPGLRVSVGEPAINPVPRAMMRLATAELSPDSKQGFDLTIGCVNGAAIAQKTFNPKLGIVGGISILGTSGIVEPLSLASWIASIEVYIRVALAGNAGAIALLPGKIGRAFASDTLQLPETASVQIANFIGQALDFVQQTLTEQQRSLPELWLLGHPGKLAKVLNGVWDTHSSKSDMAMNIVADEAATLNFDPALVRQLAEANTVEAAIDLLRNVIEPDSPERDAVKALWLSIERRIAEQVRRRVPAANRVEVRLFNLQGASLGET